MDIDFASFTILIFYIGDVPTVGRIPTSNRIIVKKRGEIPITQIPLSCTIKTTPLMTNITLFSQIISKLDRFKFNKLVNKYDTDKHQKGYTSWTHLVSMLFCQFAKS